MSKRSSPLPLMVILLVGAGFAIAGDFDDQRSFSYVGYLEDGGVAVNGDKAMRVRLFANAVDNRCQEFFFDPVAVEGGNFAVLLERINASCVVSGAMYLNIAVASPGTTSWTLVGGRQQVTGVPFAMAASGDDGLHVGAGDVRFTDASDVTTTLASGTTGVEVQVDANPADGDPLFRVLSASGGQRLRVEHDGETYTDNDFRASGSITGASLSVTGTATIDGLTTHNGDVDLTTSSMTFTDSANANADVLLTANDPDHPDEGLSVRTLSNPANGEPIFRVLSSGGHERFRVEHEGETFVDQDLAASGTITGGNVSTTGTVTFGALSGFSHSGVYNAEIEADNSTTGTQTDTTNMLSTSISVCFVSSTFLQDIEGDTEGAGCRVYRSNGTWVLEASVVSGTAHDAHATCQGRCLRWD